jgi:competence ComEA-like helix-hairpin-helix protein
MKPRYATERLICHHPERMGSLSPGLQGTSHPGCATRWSANPERVASVPRTVVNPTAWRRKRNSRGGDATLSGLMVPPTLKPRVARASQPWAEGCNPFGIDQNGSSKGSSKGGEGEGLVCCSYAPDRRQGSVLVGLLWCLAVLSVVVIGVLHTARMDLLVVKNYGDRMQAHYLALAGIEKAKALLYQDARERSRSARHHNGALYDAPELFRDVAFGRGQFRVFRRGREDEGGGMRYGISDEESRLNVNVASAEELGNLYGMTPDVVAAILDWRDEDNTVTPGGAEVEYYASLQPPSPPRKGPLQTVRELLMVRGVSRALLLGSDSHQDGLLATEGDEQGENSLADLDRGWAGLLTVDSSVKDITASGSERVNLQSADERSLTGVRGITSDIARAIVAYRGQNQFKTIADLLDVTAAQDQNPLGGRPGQAASGPDRSAPPPNAQVPGGPPSARTGPKVVSEQLLMEIGDDLTAQSGGDMPGVVNINTASLEVLACLPGLSRELAQAIVSYRKSSGFFPNTACLLSVPGVTRDIFKQVASRVSVRSETFRILSEGKVTSTGTRQRIQEIVHVGLNDLTTLSYREDDL